jgi:ABC-2 type transport system ATP-binding protein
MTVNNAPTAALRGLNVTYGAVPVLKNLDWTLLPGQVVGLLGRNAAGKTTVLESLLGLRDLQQGTVHLFGRSVDKLDDDQRARIGYVPQRSDLFEAFNADQLLGYFRSFYTRWNTSKVDGLLSRWEIPRNTPISMLSGGQQQRLSIIRALAHEPDLLVLDEPVASLDPAGRRDFLRELVDQVLDRGTTVVLSTHILSDLERVAFDVAFMRDGRIGLQAPLDDLLDQSRIVSGPTADVQRYVQQHRAEVLHHRPLVAGRESALLRVANGPFVEVPGLEVAPVNLEALFLELA